jgi:hypothetical protein
MARVQRVKITKDDAEAYVMPSAVEAWERNGWTAADDGSSEEAPAGESVAPETQPPTAPDGSAPEAAQTTKRKAQ